MVLMDGGPLQALCTSPEWSSAPCREAPFGGVVRQLRLEPEVALDRVVAGETDVTQAVLRGRAPVGRRLADVGGRAGDGGEEGVLQDGHAAGRALERGQFRFGDL